MMQKGVEFCEEKSYLGRMVLKNIDILEDRKLPALLKISLYIQVYHTPL